MFQWPLKELNFSKPFHKIPEVTEKSLQDLYWQPITKMTPRQSREPLILSTRCWPSFLTSVPTAFPKPAISRRKRSRWLGRALPREAAVYSLGYFFFLIFYIIVIVITINHGSINFSNKMFVKQSDSDGNSRHLVHGRWRSRKNSLSGSKSYWRWSWACLADVLRLRRGQVRGHLWGSLVKKHSSKSLLLFLTQYKDKDWTIFIFIWTHISGLSEQGLDDKILWRDRGFAYRRL